MAYDENLASLIRAALIGREGYAEKKMFGGVCYLLHGNMACGIVHDRLIARVGPAAYPSALAEPHAEVFDFTGRPMTGWVQVGPEGWQGEGLNHWVDKGVSFSLSLPPK